MSFMFHPYPYADPQAVNAVAGEGVTPVQGMLAVGKAIAGLLKAGKRVGLDAYPGADVTALVNVIRQQCAGPDGGSDLVLVDALSLLKDSDALEEMLSPYLPQDRDRDPVLLYGRRYRDGYPGLQDAARVEDLRAALDAGRVALVYGQGALAPALLEGYDVRVWMDITPRSAVLAFKYGHARNLGAGQALPYNLAMRRNYYVDFEVAMEQRWRLIRQDKLDRYISADVPEAMMMVDFAQLRQLFRELCQRPFRCRPVYLEGVWGGYYIHRLRGLPKAMRNCAWVFDMIPLEVSIVAQTADYEFEAPFFTFVQVMGSELLGQRAFDAFGGYFPIRFNYDDTYHSSGNMSIQCHPDGPYVTSRHGELGRQDESYYICVTGQGAKTYLGFQQADSCQEFFAKAREAERTGETIDYERYIHAVPSVPGTQVMIPAGTVHASGRNQVILEIGSLTVGSYTYKLYDYQRTDPQTGLRRPIHLKMGAEVIHGERTKEWVDAELVNHGSVLREGPDWKEIIVGEHDLLYFSLRNLIFAHQVEDDTCGTFHVLALVVGEKVKVDSVAHPERCYIMHSMDIIVVPASLGAYTITNLGVGTVTVHKTLLKEEKP